MTTDRTREIWKFSSRFETFWNFQITNTRSKKKKKKKEISENRTYVSKKKRKEWQLIELEKSESLLVDSKHFEIFK